MNYVIIVLKGYCLTMNGLNLNKTKKLMGKLQVFAEIIEHPDVDGSHSENVAEALNIPSSQ